MRSVQEAREQVALQFPKAKFSVVLWDRVTEEANVMRMSLEEEGFVVHSTLDIFDEQRAVAGDYVLSPHDAHPSPAAFTAVGKYLADEVIEVN